MKNNSHLKQILILLILISKTSASEIETGKEAEYAAALDKLNLTNKQMVASMAKKVPSDMKHQTVLVKMRDGALQPAEIYTPPGEGPWTVYLMKSHYGKGKIIGYAKKFHKRTNKLGRVVFVAMGTRRAKEAILQKPLENLDDNPWEENDVYDAVEWCAKQKWCNGKVFMVGGSGNGICAFAGGISRPPHLILSAPGSSGADFRHDWTFHNGVRRGMYKWLGSNTISKQKTIPTIRKYAPLKRVEYLKSKAKNCNDLIFITGTGWYDLAIESTLDYFEAFGSKGNVFLSISGKGHGGPRKYKGKKISPAKRISMDTNSIKNDVLFNDAKPKNKSRLIYTVLGNIQTPKSSGTVKETGVWPVPNKPTDLYLNTDNKLSWSKPDNTDKFKSFDYNPKEPVPSIGGNVYDGMENIKGKCAGPLDQRELSERKDIIRFETEPLKKDIEITGKLKSEIYLETDVSDTTITVKLLEIYPDGYQAIIRDSIVMGRYHSGYETPSPLEKGKVYKLKMDMWSIAAKFAKGNKLAIHISGSNSPKYEIHPNSYEQVTDYKNAPIAHNKIYLSNQYSSKIILPVVDSVE